MAEQAHGHAWALVVTISAVVFSGCMQGGIDSEGRGSRPEQPMQEPEGRPCDLPASSEASVLNRFAVAATVAGVARGGCVEPQGDKSQNHPENQGLPPPIHDERAVTLALGPAEGIGAECSDLRPCFDYPFTLGRTALLNATALRTGDTNGIALEVLRDEVRIQFASVPFGTRTVTLQQILDAGDYVLRLHAYRMVAGSYVLDATFHLPPRPKLPIGPDPLLEQQWGLAMSRLPEAWAYATGKGVTIAFIDSGVDLEHPDLAGKIVIVEGAALVGGSLQDSDGHGTHVAGIAAAWADNGIGIAGVAPDARVMPLRVFNVTGPEAWLDPALYTEHPDDIAQAIRLAADNGANVISMSLAATFVPGDTSGTFAPPVDAALEYAWSKGLVLVAAAGNGYAVPQCADIAAHPRVLCVGAVDPSGKRASYSNLEIGQDFVVAPGGEPSLSLDCSMEVVSTVPSGDGPCAQQVDGAWYAGMSGTSMAAPFVAGIAALLLEQGLTNEQVVKRIKDTADPRVGLEDALPDPNPLYGHGLVDGFCAVTNGSGSGCSQYG